MHYAVCMPSADEEHYTFMSDSIEVVVRTVLKWWLEVKLEYRGSSRYGIQNLGARGTKWGPCNLP